MITSVPGPWDWGRYLSERPTDLASSSLLEPELLAPDQTIEEVGSLTDGYVRRELAQPLDSGLLATDEMGNPKDITLGQRPSHPVMGALL